MIPITINGVSTFIISGIAIILSIFDTYMIQHLTYK
jgi:hypothetical protein